MSDATEGSGCVVWESGSDVGRQGGLGRPLSDVLRTGAGASAPPQMTGSGGTAVKAELGTRLVADLASNESGMALVYEALDEIVTEFSLDDAAIVIEDPGLGRQVFRAGRRRLDGDDLSLLDAEPGLYTDPPIAEGAIDPSLIMSLCTVALRMDLLRHDSWHDPLTGLYDRRSAERLLSMSVARSVRYRWPFTLVVIDLDYLKQINDSLGHSAGDAALIALAERFRRALRYGDNAARIGGDEFALILPDTTLADINALLERVANTRIGDEPCPGFSYGAAECPNEAEDPEALFNLADQRLLAAKAARP